MTHPAFETVEAVEPHFDEVADGYWVTVNGDVVTPVVALDFAEFVRDQLERELERDGLDLPVVIVAGFRVRS